MSSRNDLIMKLLNSETSSVKKEDHQFRPNLFPTDDFSSSTSSKFSVSNNEVQCEIYCGDIDINGAQVVICDNGLFNVEGDGTLQQIVDADLQGLNCNENLLGDESFNDGVPLSDWQSINNTSQPDQVDFEMIITDIGPQQPGLGLIEEVSVLEAVVIDRPNVEKEAVEVPSQFIEEGVEANEQLSGKKKIFTNS
uniref:Uncharacterized protein n=1 Tax=Homalodisca liturata TaxID=320908 RepID=A0A1B6HR59_9HEMI